MNIRPLESLTKEELIELIKHERQQRDDEWKLAVDRELTTIQSTADSYDSPAEAVRALIDWHVAVATDPTVNGASSKEIKMNIGKKRESLEAWLYLGQTFGRVGNTITRIMQKIK